MKKLVIIVLSSFAATSCISTKSTLKNIDNSSPTPVLSNNNAFVLSEYATDKKYGYDPEYPINVFYRNSRDENLNAIRFLNALAGPNGEEIIFFKEDSCCPFPTKNDKMGAGFLDIYTITWKNQKDPIKLYLNIYEKGKLLVPVGFSIKK